jgi:hypothetical protein
MPLIGTDKCIMHSRATNAKVFGKLGGMRRAVYDPENLEDFPAPKSAADIVKLLGATIVEIRKGKIEPRVALAVCSAASAFNAALEIADLAARLAALEQAARRDAGEEWPRNEQPAKAN